MGHGITGGRVVLRKFSILPFNLGVIEADLLNRAILTTRRATNLDTRDQTWLENDLEIGDFLGVCLPTDVDRDSLEVAAIATVQVQLGTRFVQILRKGEVLMLALARGGTGTAAAEVSADLGDTVAEREQRDPLFVTLVVALTFDAVDFEVCVKHGLLVVWCSESDDPNCYFFLVFGPALARRNLFGLQPFCFMRETRRSDAVSPSS